MLSGPCQGLMCSQNCGLYLFRPYRYCTDSGSHGHGDTPRQAVQRPDLSRRWGRSVRYHDFPEVVGVLWNSVGHLPQGDPCDNIVQKISSAASSASGSISNSIQHRPVHNPTHLPISRLSATRSGHIPS